MPIDAVVGANWGDEGKGKTTDWMASRADWVVRFQGGRNAGHTIVNEYGRFALHLLPSGVFRPEVENVIAPGVALDIDALLDELASLEARGVPQPKLRVSDRAQVVLPHHVTFDGYEEDRLGQAAFGSTRAGIAPFYADKALKLGIRVSELRSPDRLRARLEHSLDRSNALLRDLYGRPPIDAEDLLTRLADWGRRIAPFVADTTRLLHEALERGERVLVEGQLGALRDPDHGIHPFTTSSSPLAGHACAAAGLPPRHFDRVVAVAKAYSSCVGAGPFVCELTGPEAERLRERGNEYGATTGRPRRVGWFDAVATRYGCALQGASEVVLSLLDVLQGFDEIPVCTAYEIDGERSLHFPTSPALETAVPVFENLPGWQEDLGEARTPDDLPRNARLYVARIEELIGVPVRWVSVGPHRDHMISYAA